MKRLLWGIAAIIFGTSLISPAFAEEWIFVGIDDDRAAYFYDLESLKVSADYASVWVMWDHTIDKTVKHRTTKDQWYIGCRNQTITVLYSVKYNKSGSVISSVNIPNYLREENPIVPGSVADRISKLVCRNKIMHR